MTLPSFWKMNRKKRINSANREKSGQSNDIPQHILVTNLESNLKILRNITGNSSDIIIRRLMIEAIHRQGAIVYLDGLVNTDIISESLMESLIHEKSVMNEYSKANLLQIIQEKIITVGDIKTVRQLDELFHHLLSGEAIILIDGFDTALSASTRGGEIRQVQEPSTELTVRGPRDGFTESIRTNTALVRRRIKNPNLWLESMKIGKVTKTDVNIMYIHGIADEAVVSEVRNRLKKIDIDSILESGYIEQFIEDKTFTIFPTIYHSERPDVIAANILEGRVAIFVDGTPFVMVAPALFIQFFQAAEDYYSRSDISTAIRFLRVIVFFISLIGPATYVAVTTFHQEMIPTLLVITITAQREAVPFPAIIEAIIMEVTFEILREAGLRLPRPIGQAVSIVGALVIGQAAVQAGLVSPAMVIVVSITAIASFATPSFAIAISARLIRFIIMLLAAVLGFYGVMIGLIWMAIHLCSLRSFGVPYMSPVAPLIRKNLLDTVIRAPIWLMKERPRLISQKNMNRVGRAQYPPEINKGEKNED
ncbi:spore germination protein [Heyndrickxia camelliae]|uniref:Spore germination protein n=1 Tax=Heyndrickxia camelliae TaxID=1707093 RepID=A0A2N3LH13_9BACI|nr:spore germination protein [Heyndrickxia camelliae]